MNEDVAMLSFMVMDALVLGDGDGLETGVALIGPRVSGRALAIGDLLRVALRNGTSRTCPVVQFPLIRLDPERARWVRVTVIDVNETEVLLGATADGLKDDQDR